MSRERQGRWKAVQALGLSAPQSGGVLPDVQTVLLERTLYVSLLTPTPPHVISGLGKCSHAGAWQVCLGTALLLLATHCQLPLSLFIVHQPRKVRFQEQKYMGIMNTTFIQAVSINNSIF